MLKKSRVTNVDASIGTIEWDVYSFYHAPGIFYRPDDENGKTHFFRSGPSMMPDKYGYRLGTKEEVDLLKSMKAKDTE